MSLNLFLCDAFFSPLTELILFLFTHPIKTTFHPLGLSEKVTFQITTFRVTGQEGHKELQKKI